MLSRYVSEQEFTITQVRGIDNSLPKNSVVYKNSVNICTNFIDIIREFYNKPIIITSGYRCEAVNTKVGGSKTSQHRNGNACDFHIVGVDLKVIFNDIATGKIKDRNGISLMESIDQLIIENLLNGSQVYSGSWVHLGLSQNKPRRQKMLAIFTDGKPTYRNIVTI